MKTQKVKDLFGKPLQRDEAYNLRLFERALSEDIKKDVSVEFGNFRELCRRYGFGSNVPMPADKNKTKAYCRVVNSYLQFPRHLRVPGTHCICDIVSTENDEVSGFWRYIKGTVRKEGSDVVVA